MKGTSYFSGELSCLHDEKILTQISNAQEAELALILGDHGSMIPVVLHLVFALKVNLQSIVGVAGFPQMSNTKLEG